MGKEETFAEAYDRLNAEQKRAVDAIEGPVMVIAGPGTGKTQILTLRIANILRTTDTKPENILALTFTESGAVAMRNRLRGYIGAAAYRVPIFTFHGFAGELIRAYPDAYPRIIGGRIARDLEKISAIESILEDRSFVLLRPSGNPTYYVAPLLRMISTLKQEYITPARLGELIASQEDALLSIPRIHEKGAHKGKPTKKFVDAEKAIAKNKELRSVYERYEAVLRDQKLFDYDDMIVDTVEALRANRDMLLDLEETYQYLLADEHQDVNGSQNAILELLASYHTRPNLFVVGDEKQAIYRFQGASLENFLYFEDKFPDTLTIALTQNYRSGQSILDVAHTLITAESGALAALRTPLTAATTGSAAITMRTFSHEAVESDWLANAVKEAIKDGTPPGEIAIIVRTNREVEAIAGRLRACNVAVAPSADADILTHPITTSVLCFLDATVGAANERALFDLLHGAYWNIPAADLVRVLRAQTFDTPLAAIVRDEARLRALGVQHVDRVLRVATVLETARARMVAEAPHQTLAYMLTESGFLPHLMSDDPLEGGRVVRRLYDEIESLVVERPNATLHDVAAMLTTFRAYSIPLSAPYIMTTANAVRVMTAHKSKGLEFDVVFIPHLTDTKWGKQKTRTDFSVPLASIAPSPQSEEDDERRLLYVAMTRARAALHLSLSETNAEGKRFSPSRFLAAIEAAPVQVMPVDADETSFEPSAVIAPIDPQHADREFVLDTLAARGLSATSLNNYLKSPWDYFYKNVLRIPDAQPEHMLFGTALHAVMEQVSNQRRMTGKVSTATDIKRFLDRALGRLPLTTHGFTRRHEQGFTAIMKYLDTVGAHIPKTAKEEFSLKVSLPTGIDAFPAVTLTGKLDRVDFDAEGNIIRVVDYKTGKAKSRNEIDGKTKNADGRYKRQLVFYALMLALYAEEMGDQRYACRTATLSFLIPDAKGEIREETFIITDEEIEALKEEIIRVVAALVHGAPFDTPCDSDSEYCSLAEALMRST